MVEESQCDLWNLPWGGRRWIVYYRTRRCLPGTCWRRANRCHPGHLWVSVECAKCGGGGACHTVAGTQGGADIRSKVLGAQEAYAYIEQQQQRRQILQTFLGVAAQFQGEDAQQDGQLENKLGSLICVQSYNKRTKYESMRYFSK